MKMTHYEDHAKKNAKTVIELRDFVKSYNKWLQDEDAKTKEEFEVSNVGKVDPKKHLEESVEELMANNIMQTRGCMLSTIVF